MNLDTPEGRAAYIEAFGHKAYNQAMEAKLARETDADGIRPVSTRFGRLFSCPDGKAFKTLAEAQAHVRGRA